MRMIRFVLTPLYTPLEFFYIYYAIGSFNDSAYWAAALWLFSGVVGQSILRVIAKRKGLIE